MNFQLEGGLLLATFLVTVRLGTVFFLTRVYGYMPLPGVVKIIFVLAMAYMMVLATGLRMAEPDGVVVLAQWMANELLLGAALALAVQIMFAAYLFGGRVLDLQMGFGVATLIDPATRTQAPLIGSLLALAALAVFFWSDFHHLLFRGLFYSLETVPPGDGFSHLPIQAVVARAALMFSAGLVLVAPVVLALLLVDVTVAFIAKTMPQMNVFFLILPVKILIGLVLLAFLLRVMMPFHERMFMGLFRFWSGFIGAANG